MLLQAITGNETFSAPNAATLDVQALYRRAPRTVMIPLTHAHRDREAGISIVGAIERLPASSRSERHGQWTIARYNVPEGSLFSINMKRRIGSAMLYEHCSVVLNLRENAALRQLRIPFTANPHASMVCGYWEGRFDIVRPDEFSLVEFDPAFNIDRYLPSTPDSWYTETIVEAARTPLARPRAAANATQVPSRAAPPSVPSTGVTRKLTLRRK